MAAASKKTVTVTMIEGDGIGPEVALATRRIIEATGAPIEWEKAEAGAKVFSRGVASGVPKETIESIARTRVALKGPLETPVGHGGKSANVTLRKLFELYGNVRPTRELPGVPGMFVGKKIDLVVVRENVEDLYAGIEHMQTPGVAQCLKLISRKGCEKIVRLAFALAEAEGRKKVHCATKANIMKMTEGLLKRTFEEIAQEFPHIESEHIIIDNCAHQLVRAPEQFDIIVTTNMNGDIISDLTSGLTGGLGLAPSANIGNNAVMFEAVHGSAPTIAGKDIANPTALLLAGVMMLRHLGFFEEAAKIENSIIVTLEQGKALTVDIARGGETPASTTEFTDAVIANLGKSDEKWKVRDYKPISLPKISSDPVSVRAKSRRAIGADLFIESGLSANELGQSLDSIVEGAPFRLKMISNRGTKVYPEMDAETDCVDHWRCRFVLRDEQASMGDTELADLVKMVGAKHEWMHIEKLQEIDGERGYSLAQGED